VIFRTARPADLPGIVALLGDDVLGRTRESADLAPYAAAFEEIAANPMHQLIVAEEAGAVVAFLQLTVLHGLGRGGLTRAMVESVRVAAGLRGQGVGAALMAEAEARARAAGAGIMQLTTDTSRIRAHRFYERLGYGATHKGYKKPLA